VRDTESYLEVHGLHLSTVRSVVRSVRVARTAFALAGVLGATLIATQIGGAPVASAAPALRYVPGYSVQGSWLCYGWTGHTYNIYHCTQHWHRAGNRLVSDNPAWVPNIGTATVARPAAPAASRRAAPVSRAAAPRRVSAAPRVATPAAPASSGSVQSMIAATFGPYAGQALAVASCESGFNPGAKNPSSSASGVFQFLSSTWATTSYAGYSPFNAWANVQAAYQVFQRDGYSWREWVCQP